MSRTSDGEPAARPSIRDQIITDGVRAVLEGLEENVQEVVEEGGEPLGVSVRNYVARAASELLLRAILNPNFSHNDFALTAFARHDGGAHLVVDLARTRRRLSLHVVPTGESARLAMSSPEGAAPGAALQAPDEVGRYVGWITSGGRR